MFKERKNERNELDRLVPDVWGRKGRGIFRYRPFRSVLLLQSIRAHWVILISKPSPLPQRRRIREGMARRGCDPAAQACL
jgi:hypothetical protein